MWITVTQKIPAGTQWRQVNTDLVESVRECQGLVLHMMSGVIIEITETKQWWEKTISELSDTRSSKS